MGYNIYNYDHIYPIIGLIWRDIMTRPSWIGHTLGGRYRIDDILGQGGMSAVYKAYDPNLKRVVAVKLIHSHLADDPRFLVRFEEEAAAVAQLRHPNIVQVFDFNHDQDVYYMVQEFVPGETLQEKLRRLNKTDRRMPLNEAIGYIINICDASAFAHQRGLIHRDIKPANIMINVHGQAILMDFGIVKITGGEKHTATGAVVGTALYLAPEAIRGETPDPRSDLYALGVTLFEMVSGRPPFEADSAMTLMMMHLNDPLPDLRTLRADIPAALVAVIEKALAKDREQRYVSMTEFAAALRGVLAGLDQAAPVATQADGPIPAPSKPTFTPAPHPASAAEPLAAPGENAAIRPRTEAGKAAPPAKKAGKLPLYAGIGVGSLAILALLIAALLLIPGEEDPLTALPSPSATTAPLAALPALPTATLPAASATAAASPTSAPALALLEITAPTITPSLTPTIPVGVPYARINGIAIDTLGSYVVDYETFEYTETLPGQHVHFFFNSVNPDQAGLPGAGPWILYGGPRPFTDYATSDRPAAATQMCVLVANPDHSVRQESGNCYTLPDVTAAVPVFDDPCLAGPGAAYPVLGQLKAGQVLLVTALSPDEAWWTVDFPDTPGVSCWLQRSRADFSGDISTLPMAEIPQGGAASLSVAITGITLNDQGQYVVAFSTSGFTPALPGTHLHFYFDIFAREQLSGIGSNRLMYAGLSPFTGYTQLDRPQNAAQLCALVANPDHTVIPGSGNCSQLP
jgi:tRNA A-37 threonylcarbamoyl transferase component Bud32